ncbi:lipoprotein-releasing system permease protein [Roseimicrobium gellanilyticum]|uniref:Lipoprotein-releasing system permease protein n=1 Tax=Roseimicrobium gellanilyticum TaxID=748857 RepID=A0A366HB11_9BACT|nr:ABC transporter permease [Roseimicrobium gellanilyticum]RBP38671.1 lipoprotein-releasing system permease protein [Roseimicrobium gellanilyticum]
MTKNFSLYLALRYLRPKRTFVSVITVISILGVSLGVALLIVVIAVMAGFHAQMKELAAGYETHIEAADRYGTSMLDSKQRPKDAEDKPWREILEQIKKTPGVVSATPMVRGLLLVESESGTSITAMWGLSNEDGNRLAEKHAQFMRKKEEGGGSMDLSGSSIVLDHRLADPWGLKVGDTITAYAPSNLKEVMNLSRQIDDLPEDQKKAAYEKLKELTLPEELTITGIIEPPQFQDSSKVPLAIVSLVVAQEARDLGDGISSIGIELSDPYQAAVIRNQLLESKVIPPSWDAYTWTEAHQALFSAVQTELLMMYVILFFIMIVAAFCVMNTMITVTVQKRREIGIVAALGSRVGQTMSVFIIQGMIVGAAGAVLGLGLGILIASNINTIKNGLGKMLGMDMFNPDIYGLIDLPAKVLPNDVAFICGSAFLLSSLASVIPAWLAAKVEPAQALRD